MAMPYATPGAVRSSRRYVQRQILPTIFLLLCALALTVAVCPRCFHVPEERNPFAPLRVEAPLNLLTRAKLWRVAWNDELCRSVLQSAGLRYEAIEDHETGVGCGFHNAVTIERMTQAGAEPFSLSCRSAVALALWERHVLQPAARAYFGEPVATLEHFGSYSCRNVYGRQSGRRSLHATADAIDVAGFVLASGHRIRIVNDWSGDDRESRFLHDLHDGACRVFDAVLGPEHNEAHRDHFHLDRGSYRVCH